MSLDFFGALLSLLSTYYFIRLNHRAWIITLIATCLNGLLYWQKGIYADMMLEGYYFISTCYGSQLWLNETKEKSIYYLSIRQWFIVLVSIMSLYGPIFFFLTAYTDSNIASIDALTTATSLVAQWLMCHKAIATWILWFFTDSIYAYVYFKKQLPFHCFLMIIYSGMAVIGYLAWLRYNANFYTIKHQS